jgi:streptogramin lyase
MREQLLGGFFFLSCLYLFAQSPVPFQRVYTIKDGLSHNDIRCIAQDQYGFLWIGTWEGLCRYDGFEFKRYYCDPNDPSSLPYSHIMDIAVDKYNNIWVAGKTLSRYDRFSDKFIRPDKKKYGSTFSEDVGCVKTDPEGNLFVATKNGIYFYENTSDSLIKIRIVDRNGHTRSYRHDNFFIDCNNYFWFINPGPDSIYQFKLQYDSPPQDQRSLLLVNQFSTEISPITNTNFGNQYFVYPTSDDRVWFMSNDGIYLKAEKSDLIRQASKNEVKDNEFRHFHSVWWADKVDGINILYPDKHNLVTIPINTINNPQIIFQDKDGSFWCGNLDPNETGAGLHQFIFHFTGFNYYPDPSKKEYSNLAVFSVFKNNESEIFLGTKNFPYILKIKPDGIVEKTNPVNANPWNTMYQPRAFLLDKNKRLWVGYLQKILRQYDYSAKVFSDIHLKPEFHFPDIPIPAFRFLAQARNGKMISGGIRHIILFDPDSMVINKVKFMQGDIYSACVDDHDNFLLGSGGKLLVYSNMLNPVDSFSIGDISFNIESICKDDSVHLWLGLLMGGFCRLNIRTRHLDFFTVKNGLANNTVYNILKDHSGKLWISTDAGISVFNPVTGKFFNYDESNGLYIREFNSDAAFFSSDGEMLFGGMGGVVGFYPERMEQVNKQINTWLMITGIQYRKGKQDTIFPIYDMKSIRLPAGTKNLQVTFSYIDFQNQQKTNFRYRLAGMNDYWGELQTNIRIINLMSLKHGNYQLEIQATDLNGEWWKTGILQIIIPPYYYETNLFKIFIGLSIAGIITIFISMRLRNFRLRQNQRLTQLKLSTLQGQMNPHFLSNSLAAADSFIASKDSSKANEYLGELRDMMRDLIDYTGKEYIPMTDELNLLNRYLRSEQIRTEDLFDYEIRTGETSVNSILLAPSMIQPFAENAIKYAFKGLDGRKGQLLITFLYESFGMLLCLIEDNGIGREQSTTLKPSGSRKSKGIELVKERLEIFNKMNKTRLTLKVEDSNPSEKYPGTRVTIQIPSKFIT